MLRSTYNLWLLETMRINRSEDESILKMCEDRRCDNDGFHYVLLTLPFKSEDLTSNSSLMRNTVLHAEITFLQVQHLFRDMPQYQLGKCTCSHRQLPCPWEYWKIKSSQCSIRILLMIKMLCFRKPNKKFSDPCRSRNIG